MEKDLLQQQRYKNPIFPIPDKNIEIPTVDFWRNEITITSSYGAAKLPQPEGSNSASSTNNLVLSGGVLIVSEP